MRLPLFVSYVIYTLVISFHSIDTASDNPSEKRIGRDKAKPLAKPEKLNNFWSMNFIHDQLETGRSFRLFNVIDNLNREGFGN